MTTDRQAIMESGPTGLAGKRKEPPNMTTTRDKVNDAADNVKPYVERALTDPALRANVRNAYQSARTVYDELIGNCSVTGLATKVAGDKEIQDELRSAVSELRRAAERVQGKTDAPVVAETRGSGVLLAIGLALALLFNPITGQKTRTWLSERLLGGGGEFTYQGGNGSGAS
jgi:hypothetical protein